jgi:hypothetical protein
MSINSPSNSKSSSKYIWDEWDEDAEVKRPSKLQVTIAPPKPPSSVISGRDLEKVSICKIEKKI